MTDLIPNWIGLDLGGTKILAGRLDAAGRVLAEARRPTPRESSWAVVEAVAETIAGLRDRQTRGIGISTLSLVDNQSPKLGLAGPVPVEGVPLGPLMAERFGLPVIVDNDANAATWAEFRLGAGQGVRHFMLIAVGTGIGSGLVLDGRLVRGARGVAGEIGMVRFAMPRDGLEPAFDATITAPGGLPRFEDLASGTALDTMARAAAAAEPECDLGVWQRDRGSIDGAAAAALAEAGDGQARRLIEALGVRLGIGAAAAVEMLNPELILFGGGVFADGRRLLDQIRATIDSLVVRPGRDVRIARAALGPAAGMIGAALLASEHHDTDKDAYS